MSDTISYNPAELQGISTAFNTFDSSVAETLVALKDSADSLKMSWEGDDAEEAGVLIDELNDALESIKTNSTSYNKVLNAKSEGFGNIRF